MLLAKSFFFRTIVTLFSALALLGAFNGWVDPIRLFSSPEIKGFNYYKPTFFTGQFVGKPYVVRNRKPDGIILGTSRAGASMSTQHPAWQGYRAYNFALAGTTSLVQWWNFQHASALAPLRRAVIGLDFFMFNSCSDQSREKRFQEYKQRLAAVNGKLNWNYPARVMIDYLSELTSLPSTRASWTTWRTQALFAEGAGPLLHIHDDGFWRSFPAQGVSQRKAFVVTERHHLRSAWFPQPGNCYSLAIDGKKVQLSYLRQLLDQAHKQDTQVILYFSPFHASFAEAMVAAGLWEQFEQLKREVLSLNLASAEAAGSEAYPLWDFSGYNSITTEAVPLANDTSSRMKYFLDGTHSTPLTGTMVQDVIFAMRSAIEPAPGDFGVRLSRQNIEQDIVLTRSKQKAYRLKHAKEFEELIKTAAKFSRKP